MKTSGNPIISYGSAQPHNDEQVGGGEKAAATEAAAAAAAAEQHGGNKDKTLTWTTAAVVIFAFAMGSGVTSAGYLVTSTGIVVSPVLLIVTAFFSFAGSRLLLLICEQHPNSVVDLGDAGRIVGGGWLEWLGRGSQFLVSFLGEARDVCGYSKRKLTKTRLAHA